MWGQPPSAVLGPKARCPHIPSDNPVIVSIKAGRATLDWTAEGGCPHIQELHIPTLPVTENLLCFVDCFCSYYCAQNFGA